MDPNRERDDSQLALACLAALGASTSAMVSLADSATLLEISDGFSKGSRPGQ